jgi:hypothetical protein
MYYDVTEIRTQVMQAMWEASWYKLPYSIFNHPVFPRQAFTLNYIGQ